MRNKNGIFWGLFLLLSAVILVVSQMHLLTYTLSFWTIVFSLFLLAVLIKSLVYFSIPGSVFSLAFLAILYAKPLGITNLVPWTILGAALLVSMGLSLILRPLLFKHRPWFNYKKGYTRGHHGPFVSFDYNAEPDMKTVDAPDVDVYVKMGNSVRYVKSDDFQTANVDVNMGEAKVYFDHVTVKDTAEINVNVSLGGAELYIPRDWNVVKNINNNMGNITENGTCNINGDDPDVVISGLVSLGNLKINYI